MKKLLTVLMISVSIFSITSSLINVDGAYYYSVPDPVDSDGDTYLEIEYIEQLQFIMNTQGGESANYELMNDLDFNDNNSYWCYGTGTDTTPADGWNDACIIDWNEDGSSVVADPKTEFTTSVGWDPIGDDTLPFTGKFNGNGYTISNLYINRTTNYNGLFGYVSPSSKLSSGYNIEQINFNNSTITGARYNAVVAGYIANTRIDDVDITGKTVITYSSSRNAFISGYGEASDFSNITVTPGVDSKITYSNYDSTEIALVVGEYYGGTIENIVVNIANQIVFDVDGEFGFVAGYVTNSAEEVAIENVDINVESTVDINATWSKIGLFVGMLTAGIVDNIVVNVSGSLDITGDNEAYGIFAGYTSSSTINNSTIIIDGAVNIDAVTRDYVGGIIGNNSGSSMSNVSFTNNGTISLKGDDNIGAIVGYGTPTGIDFTNNNSITITGDTYVGGIIGGASAWNTQITSSDIYLQNNGVMTVTGNSNVGAFAGGFTYLKLAEDDTNIEFSNITVDAMDLVGVSNVGSAIGYIKDYDQGLATISNLKISDEITINGTTSIQSDEVNFISDFIGKYELVDTAEWTDTVRGLNVINEGGEVFVTSDGLISLSDLNSLDTEGTKDVGNYIIIGYETVTYTTIPLVETHHIDLEFDEVTVEMGSELVLPEIEAYKLYGYYKTDLTNDVITTGEYDLGEVGTYEITYTLTAYNEHEEVTDTIIETLTINVVDTTPPVVKVSDEEVRVVRTTDVDYLSYIEVEEGAVVEHTEIDSTKCGEQEINYTVTDKAGNITEVTVNVIVEVPITNIHLVHINEQQLVYIFDERVYDLASIEYKYMWSNEEPKSNDQGWMAINNVKKGEGVVYVMAIDKNGNAIIREANNYFTQDKFEIVTEEYIK